MKCWKYFPILQYKELLARAYEILQYYIDYFITKVATLLQSTSIQYYFYKLIKSFPQRQNKYIERTFVLLVKEVLKGIKVLDLGFTKKFMVWRRMQNQILEKYNSQKFSKASNSSEIRNIFHRCIHLLILLHVLKYERYVK